MSLAFSALVRQNIPHHLKAVCQVMGGSASTSASVTAVPDSRSGNVDRATERLERVSE